jgi:hypothetical protein
MAFQDGRRPVGDRGCRPIRDRLVKLIVVLACVVAAAAGNAAAATITPFGFGFTAFQSAFVNCPSDQCKYYGTEVYPETYTVDTQAGTHPGEAIFFGNFKTHEPESENPVGEVREVVTNLPPGLVANPHVTPQCTREQLDRGLVGECPADTQVGTVTVHLAGFVELTLPLYNMVPPSNQPLQLGLIFKGTRQFFNTFIRTGSDYGASARVPNIVEDTIIHFVVRIWGIPADPVYNDVREGVGPSCSPDGPTGDCASDAPLKPFWTMPTACGAPLTTTATADAWGHETELSEISFLTESEGLPFGYTGCEHLQFTPSISITPGSADAETPTGLSVELKEPQEGVGEPVGASQSDIKTTTAVLPEGIAVNPGSAAGLAACQFSEDGVGTTGPPHCPAASKLGTVAITTPLLNENPEGNVYLLQSTPPNVKLLLSAYAAGIYVKLIGSVTLNENTGQATATFAEIPQFPVSSVNISFGGGPKAALMTPPTCGVYGTTSDFTPWSTPFVADAISTDSFPIEAGPDGGPCVSRSSQLAFSPKLTAGSTSDQAGGYTGFSMLLQREDGQQQIANLQFKTPEGLLGKISSVTLCEEPLAALGDCPESSKIGHTIVGAGPGPFPLFLPEPGEPPAPIFLTGPYEGAPYGLAVVVPVVAGPFNLGTVVVRARIEVDPYTSRLTITFNPATLPTILHGVPADIRDINAVLDRREFMFNPTSCAPMSFTGTAYSTEGASAPLSTPFQVGSCRSLKFNPNFKVSTQGRTSRADGASLTVKLVYPTGALGANQASSQSNLQLVKVELPKRLPSRLTTLQKACLAAVFDTNPAACPPQSVVGHVRVITPVLAVPLTGPAYFVSHGGEAFPSLVVVLQGAGVTIDLVGSTYINGKTGITSSTFKSIPDVPTDLFELTLPEGPYSALAANGSLCGQTLEMPSEFIAQNGAVIDRNTKLSVTDCPKKAAIKTRKRKPKGSLTTDPLSGPRG